MLEIKVTQDQIKQLAMDWYKPIMAEIEAEQSSPSEEVATESIQGELDKAEALMYMLTHSYLAKVFAVQCVCNKKNNDAKKLTTCGERYELALTLNARGYRSDAVVRKEIPKANVGTRRLSIPSVRDRAMRTLYRIALEPVAEYLGDEHSYGFRPNRNTADAVCHCLDILNGKDSPQYVLEGDICRCFDTINRQWIMDNIPVEKKVLKQFLHRMYIADGKLFPVTEGIPQGACISPVICNMVLDGIEPLLKQHFGEAVQFVRYADDFVVIGHDRDMLERSVIPLLTDFLSVRGRHLSEDKTVITHIDTGFDFLGWHIQRYGKLTIATPSDKNILSLRTKVESVLSSSSLIRIFVNKIYLYDDKITIIFKIGDEEVEITRELLDKIEEGLGNETLCFSEAVVHHKNTPDANASGVFSLCPSGIELI